VFCYKIKVFFLENAGELRFIIIRRKKGKKSPNTTHTTPPKKTKIHTHPETKRLPSYTSSRLQKKNYRGGEGKPRKIAPAPQPKPTTDSPPKQKPKRQPSWE
jgi:hypothetical protein